MDLTSAIGIEKGSVVAFVGGGGKTSTILRLAGNLHASGKRVAVTSTTRMRIGERIEPSRLVLSEDPTDLARKAGAVMDEGLVPFLFSRTTEGKHVGLPPETVDALAGGEEIILVEADGAKGRPLKVPRAHDPVVPESTKHLVILAGATALTSSRADAVFPPGAAEELAPGGNQLTPMQIAGLLHRPEGFLSHAPGGGKTTILVNQADAITGGFPASLIDCLGHGAVHRIVYASALSTAHPVRVFGNRSHRIASVVLAAGRSTRFGGLKQVAPIGGRPMVLHALDAARAHSVEKTFVVVGHEAERVREVVGKGPDVEIVDNPAYGDGLASSVRTGLGAAKEFDAVLIVLGDLPFMGKGLAEAAVESYRSCTAPLCFPMIGGQRAHPVLIRRDLWGEMEEVQGDEGGRMIIKKHGSRASTFEWADCRARIDIDRKDDHEAVRESH